MEHHEIDMIAHSKRGAMTLCLSPNTGENVRSSLLVAEEIAKELKRGKVLYLNTVHSRRQLASVIRRQVSEKYSARNPDPRITHMTCTAGILNSLEAEIRIHLANGVRFIILNSLEFSSKDYRRKDELFYQINQWIDEFDASVIIFSQRIKAVASSGAIQRGGGVGKFAGVASSVNYLSVAEPDGSRDDDDTEGESAGEYEIRREAREREEKMREWEEKQKAKEEADLIEKAKVLAREQAFLAADVPVWKAADEEEEQCVIKAFRSYKVIFTKGQFESQEHYHKRLMAAIALNMELCPARYTNILKEPFLIVHSNDEKSTFEEELLPAGGSSYDYDYPDKLPIPGQRMPRLKKSSERARELLM